MMFPKHSIPNKDLLRVKTNYFQPKNVFLPLTEDIVYTTPVCQNMEGWLGLGKGWALNIQTLTNIYATSKASSKDLMFSFINPDLRSSS